MRKQKGCGKKVKKIKRIMRYCRIYDQGIHDVLFTLNHVYGKKFVGEFLYKAKKQLEIEFIKDNKSEVKK
jgi:hypothetical protein